MYYMAEIEKVSEREKFSVILKDYYELQTLLHYLDQLPFLQLKRIKNIGNKVYSIEDIRNIGMNYYKDLNWKEKIEKLFEDLR